MLSSSTSPDLWICVLGSPGFLRSLKGGGVKNNTPWKRGSRRKVCVFMRTVFDLDSKKYGNFSCSF